MMENNLHADLAKLKKATSKLRAIDPAVLDEILLELADCIVPNTAAILDANRKDLERMDPTDPKYDRLLLNEVRLHDIVADLRNVARLASPLGQVLREEVLASGLSLSKVRVPIGVVAVVYESRPNVTFDVFALCFKTANASLLKGSREAESSNRCIVDLIASVLRPYQLEDTVYLAPAGREYLQPILEAVGLVDVIIPRGSAALIDHVRANARGVPVIETGAGIVHTYYDRSADLEKGRQVIANAKTRRVSVCNALDTLVIHEDRLADLPMLLHGLDRQFGLEIFADEQAYEQLRPTYDHELLHLATDQHFGTEFLSMKMSVKTVKDIHQAIAHIDQHSSRHSEAIIAEAEEATAHFVKLVDAAAVYVNTSTAFTDGAQFGLGAEIGISTQKLHARGPMGLEELTSYKWVATSEGLTRS